VGGPLDLLWAHQHHNLVVKQVQRYLSQGHGPHAGPGTKRLHQQTKGGYTQALTGDPNPWCAHAPWSAACIEREHLGGNT
jgi:hypothetical protein